MKKILILIYGYVYNTAVSFNNFMTNLLNFIDTFVTVRKSKNNIPFFDLANELNIVVNGPSFADEFTNNPEKFTDKDILCVNTFVNTEYYEILKPKYYAIADSKLWNPIKSTEKLGATYEQNLWNEIPHSLVKKTKWKQFVFLPHFAKSNPNLIKILEENANLELVFVNMSIYKGFERLKYSFYDKQFCVPLICNVLAYAIYIAILSGYKQIKLYGADHSLFNNLSVSSDNKVIICAKHSYNQSGDTRFLYHPDGSLINMGEYLAELSSIWKTYYELELYAKYRNCHILNCTKNSYIDAFDRVEE